MLLLRLSRDVRSPGEVHPFGQIPTYEQGDLALFETGSIVFHIAEHHSGRIPEPAAYVARGEARTAYQRAFTAQLEIMPASHQAAD